MNPHQVLMVVARVLALLGVLSIVGQLRDVYTSLNQYNAPPVNLTGVWLFAWLQFSVVLILWLFPATVARYLLPKAASTTSNSTSLTSWQGLVVVGLGLWLLAKAVPSAAYWITIYSTAVQAKISWALFTPEQRAEMVSTVVEFLLGLWLTFGARTWVGCLFKFQDSDRPA